MCESAKQQQFGTFKASTNAKVINGVAWVIHLHGKPIDIVWDKLGLTASQLRNYLVYHEGQDVNIDLQRPS
ncbi:MAG: hypothetical protein JWP44_4142 [Mucilaginibacter sp.]|nr:hypothetical protein [Mucilaginibacter sp.]